MTLPLPRRCLVAALLPLTGCMPPPTPAAPPRPEAEQPPALPLLTSLAAFAEVRAADPVARHAVLQTVGGGLIDVAGGPQLRNFGVLRQGARVVVEYEAGGQMRVAPASRVTQSGGGRRARAVVQSVAIGGGEVTLVAPNGQVQDFAIEDRPMMAFATRLRAGDEVAITYAAP